MGTTQGGLYQWGGVPVATANQSSMFDNYWFVDNSRAASGNGKSPSKAYTTIAAAIAVASAGDTIFVRGTGTDYDEAVTLALDRVSLIGVGNTPRQVGWNSDVDTTCLTITGRYCRVSGFGFRPDGATTGYAINLADDAAGTKAYDTVIDNNYFRSTGATAKAAILANGVPENCKIINNIFTWVDYVIKSDSISNKVARGWEVRGNHILSTVTHGISLDSARCVYIYNTFDGPGSLDTVGTAGTGVGSNHIFMNSFGGDFSLAGYYKFNATDNFAGNYATDYTEVEVDATTGNILAVPAS